MLSSLKGNLQSQKSIASTSAQRKEDYRVFRNDRSSSDRSSSDEDSVPEDSNNEQQINDTNFQDQNMISSHETNERPKVNPPRGPNKCSNLSSNEKTIVTVNHNGQPIGKNGRKLSSYLGLLARDPKLVPLDRKDWRKFKTTENVDMFWKIILKRFTFEGLTSPKDWALDKMNHCLRSWRRKLKKKHYKPGEKSLADLLKPPNNRVDPEQWVNLVHKWESEAGRASSQRNFDNHMKSTMAHHLGTKSLARLRNELTKDGKEPDRLTIFENEYGVAKKKPVDPVSEKKIAEAKNHIQQLPPECDIVIEREKIFELVVGEEKGGYKRTYGIGVKASTSYSFKLKNSEAFQMVEQEMHKRQALEEEVASEKQKRVELEQEIATEANKRKELEEQMLGEKRKREALEEEMRNMKEMLSKILPGSTLS